GLAARIRSGAPDLPRLEKSTRHGPLPLSGTQEWIWWRHQILDGIGDPLQGSWSMTWNSAIDLPALESAIDEVIQRHEALRTTFPMIDGQIVQVITPVLSVPLTTVDLRAWPDGDRSAEAARRAREEEIRPFDLERGP